MSSGDAGAADRPYIDTDRCVGSGDCALVAPLAFEVGDEGFAEVLDTWREDDPQAIDDAIYGCPTGAIERLATEDR